MGISNLLKVSASGLNAEAHRMDVITANITNADMIYDDGTPYVRQVATFREQFDGIRRQHSGKTDFDYKPQGVEIGDVIDDLVSPFTVIYNPSSPYADENGYVTSPNVDMTQEMTDLVISNRAYSASNTAYSAAKDMYKKALSIGE